MVTCSHDPQLKLTEVNTADLPTAVPPAVISANEDVNVVRPTRKYSDVSSHNPRPSKEMRQEDQGDETATEADHADSASETDMSLWSVQVPEGWLDSVSSRIGQDFIVHGHLVSVGYEPATNSEWPCRAVYLHSNGNWELEEDLNPYSEHHSWSDASGVRVTVFSMDCEPLDPSE